MVTDSQDYRWCGYAEAVDEACIELHCPALISALKSHHACFNNSPYWNR